jgi:NTE family protein
MTAPSERRIGLALGGGGARGLAHLHVLEAFDELGVRPAAIVGASIGALMGACYAAGLGGRDLREHTLAQLSNRGQTLAKVMKARVGRISDLFGTGSLNPMLLDAEALIPQFLPPGVPERFEDLAIPFQAIATDFFGRAEVVLRDGPLLPAIAASAAIPGLFKPVLHGGRTLIDGAMTNPLPFDALKGVDAVIAVDVTGGPVMAGPTPPNAFVCMLGAIQIMQSTIVAGKVAQGGPDVLIRPKVDRITLLDFLKVASALRLSADTKDEAKRAIERLLSG